MDLMALVMALTARKMNPAKFRAAVEAYMEEHPEAVDQAAIEALFADQLDGIEEDVGGLKSALNFITHDNVTSDQFIQGRREKTDPSTVISDNTRVSSKNTFNLYAGDVISVTGTYTGVKFAIGGKASTNYDSGWKTSAFSYEIVNDGEYFVLAAKSNGTDAITPSDVDFVITLTQGIQRNLSQIKSDINNLNNLTFIDVTENLTYEGAWIRYENGEKVASSAARLFTIPSDSLKAIRAFLTSSTSVLCAIAFYNTTSISTGGYMKNASVDFEGGTHDDGLWYEATIPVGCKLVAITTKVPSETVADYVIKFDIGYIGEKVTTEINNELKNYATKTGTFSSTFIGRLKPCYDHLFVNKTGDNVIIPHESLFHVRISAKLGFNCIEANIAQTSDGVYIVNHLDAGKFGGFFHHVDGVTDISNIAVSSVTWAWIAENVRYNSTIPKYRTRPCTLEEFLGECKQQNLIPFATTSTVDMIKAVEHIMGKNNFVAYSASRANLPDAVICHWVSNLTTKDAILAYCKTIGVPFIYCLGNPSAFTTEQLSDIVNTLHENGFLIGISYDDTKWFNKYAVIGFDFNGTQYLCNRIENGNICNFETIFNYNDFTITNGVELNGVISFSTDGTIRPNIPDTTIAIGASDIEVDFSGSIIVEGRTLLGNMTVTNEERGLYIYSSPIINNHPKFTIVCQAGTTIYGIKFKATKC